MKMIAKGWVDEIDISKNVFWCRLSIEENGIISDDCNCLAEIDIDKLSKRERPLLDIGMYICILKGGTIRFMRIPGYTKKQIRLARAKAIKLSKFLDTIKQ